MFDFIVTAVFVLLAAVLAFDSFKKWRAGQGLWFAVAAVVSVLSAIGTIVDWASGLYAIILALILRAIADFISKRNP